MFDSICDNGIDGCSPHPVAISGANLTGGKAVIRIGGGHNRLLQVTVKNGPDNGVEVGDFSGVGSARNLAQRLLEAWRNLSLSAIAIRALLTTRVRQSFDTS